MDTIRILLIDDDEDDYLITRDLLAEIEGQAFDLKWVDGGDEGLAMLKAGDYDVCLLDYRLGPGTGLELMSAAHEQGVHVPFILMTGMSDRAIDLQAMSAGAADYLIKGQINAALLERSIRYSIQQHRMIEALRLSEERLGEALRMSESRFRRLSNSNMIGIIVGSLDGPISEANDAFLSMAGYSCADLESGALQWTAMTPEEYQAADAEALREIASHGASRPYEKEYLRKDGTRVPVLMGLALLEGSSDTFIAFVLDLLEQKRIERELHAASKAKDHFLAVLSHELRTPLTPVLSLVQVLEEDESLADDTREFVDIIRRNVELEARLIDDLLDLTRVIQGKLILQLAEIDVEHVIRQVLDICRADLDAKSLDLTVEWRAARSLLHGDSARLHQVFWNLLKNAAKFTPADGAISIRSYNQRNRMIVEVSDSGTGIDPEILPSIFNPFEQGTVQVTRRFGGLGLGLTISRSLIELHGGTITAASEGKDRGATFTVELPLMMDVGHGDETAVEKIPELVAGNGPAIRRILLVEDHADTRRTIKKLLESRGYEVKDVGAVADALDAAASAPAKFDLLISDIGLPDGTGSELITKLREREPIRGIAMSGYGMDHDIQRSLEAGFSSHIVKPVVFQQLIDEILRLQPA